MMPYTALGAIVLYTGYKLCAPKVWKHVAHIGSEQLFVFTTTVLVTVSTDLLWGIAAGILAKVILEMVMVARVVRGRPEGHEPLGVVVKRRLGETGELFRNPVIKSVDGGGAYHIYFGRPLVCFNSLHLHRELSLVPSGATVVTIHVTDLVTLIDHTTATILLDFVDNFKRTGRGVATIVGLDNLRARSRAEASMRVSAPVLAQERIDVLNALARVSLTYDSPEVDPITYLERISLTHVGPIVGEVNQPIRGALIRVGEAVVGRFRVVTSFFRTTLTHDEQFKAADRDQTWTGLSLIEHETTPQSEIEKLSLSFTAHTRVERRGWWSSLDQVAVTADEEAHPIRLALGHIGRLLARLSRSLFRAVRAFSGRTAAPASLSPIEEAGSPSETAGPSLAASDDPRDLLE